jgi:hypothetical protein
MLDSTIGRIYFGVSRCMHSVPNQRAAMGNGGIQSGGNRQDGKLFANCLFVQLKEATNQKTDPQAPEMSHVFCCSTQSF